MTPTALGDPLRESRPGPALRVLTDHLLATPGLFLRAEVSTEALLGDAVDLVLDPDEAARARGLDAASGLLACPLPTRLAANVACHLLATPALRAALGGSEPRELVRAVEVFAGLVRHVPLRQWFGTDPERHEEVARALLRTLGLRPDGETHEQAEDRWTSVSTAVRAEGQRLALVEQQKAAELAKALADKKAREAAAQYTYV